MLEQRGEECECCHAPARHVHHIITVATSGIDSELAFEPANMMVLCNECHALMHPGIEEPQHVVAHERGRPVPRPRAQPGRALMAARPPVRAPATRRSSTRRSRSSEELLEIERERLRTAREIEKRREMVFPETTVIVRDIERLLVEIERREKPAGRRIRRRRPGAGALCLASSSGGSRPGGTRSSS